METTVAMGLILFIFYLGYFLLMWMKSRGWKSLHNPGLEECAPFVSVVVPTYNEEDTIVHKLKNLMEQDYPSMEIIVVEGASEDRTVELIKKFVKDHDLDVKLIMEEDRRGKASALNEAFKHCSGEIVVLTDADAIFEKDTVAKIVKNFDDTMIGAVTGRLVIVNADQSSVTRLEKSYRRIFEIIRRGESALDSTPIFNGPISAFRRKLLTDELESSTIADDTELSLKFREKGYRAIYDSEAIAYEYTPITFKSRVEQKRRRGQGIIQSLMRHKRMMFNLKYGKFGGIVFPAEFFMHIVSPILVSAFLISLPYGLLLMDNYLLFSLIIAIVFSFVALTIMKIHVLNFILSFLNSQFILVLSLICHMFGRSEYKWRKISEIRGLLRKETPSI